jgi:ligand-binding sensor domain-containing protein
MPFPLFSRTARNWLCLMFLLPLQLLAQDFQHVQVITTEQGLSNRQVRSILQDQEGYMWFGTANGLNRFDGNKILVLNSAHSLCPLSENTIGKIKQDRRGLIWVSTNQGIDLIDPVKFNITYLQHRENMPGTLAKGTVSDLWEDKHGTMWVAFTSGYLQQHLGNGKFQTVLKFERQKGKLADFIFQINELSGKEFLLTSRFSGAYRVNKNGEIITHYPLNQRILSANFQTDSSLLAGTDEGIYVLEKGASDFIKVPQKVSFSSVESLHADRSGNIWGLGSGGELLIKKTGQNQFEALNLEPLKNGTRYTTFYEDKSGNYWFGSYNGVVKATLQRQLFTRYLAQHADKPTSWQSMRSLVEDDLGNIWIGGYNALYKLPPGAEKPESITLPQSREGRKISLVPYAMIHEKGSLWMATEGEGLVRFEIATNRFIFSKHFSRLNHPKSPRNTYLISLLKLPAGELWMGSYGGIYFKKPDSDSIYNYLDLYPGIELGKLRTNTFLNAGSEGVWVGTERGFYALDPETKAIRRSFLTENGQRQNVVSLTNDRWGNLWIGTKGGGLYQLPKGGKSLRHLTTRDGLSDNVINALIADGQQVWISTDNGLNQLDFSTGKFRHFFLEDGLTNNEFNHSSFLKTRAGDILFGGINGVNRFNPKVLLPLHTTENSPLLITQLDYYDKERERIVSRFNDLQKLGGIKLPYEKQYLNVHFALADYTRPETNQYAYLIEGYDKKWHNIGNQNFVRLLGLPAGQFTLRIKAAGSDGIWSSYELRLPLTAEVPFYRSWWFLLLAFGLVSGIGAAFYFFRMRQLKRMLALRTRIATDLHDQVGSYLTRIAISSDMLKEAPAGVPAHNYVEQIATSSRSAVTTMSDVIWSIDSRSDTVGDLLLRIREHSQELFEPTGIDYVIETEGLEENRKLSMDQRHHLYLICKEATHNIVKHAGARKARISLKARRNQLELLVSDDGQPNEQQKARTGQGLRNMQLRAEELKGQLQIETKPSFSIRLKCQI